MTLNIEPVIPIKLKPTKIHFLPYCMILPEAIAPIDTPMAGPIIKYISTFSSRLACSVVNYASKISWIFYWFMVAPPNCIALKAHIMVSKIRKVQLRRGLGFSNFFSIKNLTPQHLTSSVAG